MSVEKGGRMTTVSQEHVLEGQRIVLEARAFSLRLPFAGLVWNRPVAVRVFTTDGEKRLPVRDVTRLWQIAIYGVGLVCLAAGLLVAGRGRKE